VDSAARYVGRRVDRDGLVMAAIFVVGGNRRWMAVHKPIQCQQVKGFLMQFYVIANIVNPMSTG
ncbi:MAG: hypothetical protein LBS62_04485, partial [Clostridiales bacterium]|nr:hypothetical protein [Clostridiales bacterium]